LAVGAEVKEAVLRSERIRQDLQREQGEGRQVVLRGIVVVCCVVIASVGKEGRQAVTALRQALRYWAGRPVASKGLTAWCARSRVGIGG
jgi:hypothetical protein